jgi:bifunctional UDP-N-acetylglucosamine pyrophosphorylase/glucosamine-1-phosphate N-acetyltransferase
MPASHRTGLTLGLADPDDRGPSTPGRELADAGITRRSPRRPGRSLAVVVLAAGKGKRLKSATPKVLHPICGKPALWHVLQAALGAKPDRVVVVVGHGADDVKRAVRSWGLRPEPAFVTQKEQLGTGHAVKVARRAIGDADDVLVLGGDYDPVTDDHVRDLVRVHRRSRAAASLLSAEIDEPGGYGRVIREGDRLVRIVEHADATVAERRIHEVVLLAFAFRCDDLFRELPRLSNENRQGEYYLTDLPTRYVAAGRRVSVVTVDTGGAMGLNSRGGLASVARVVRERINEHHMANGVTLIDPATTYIDVDVRIGRDTVIRPNTFLEGDTRIGEGCDIGPNVRATDSTIDERCRVQFAVLEGAVMGAGSDAGPFARLRPGAMLAEGVHVGTSVEIKGSTIGRGSKVPHLSYIGDAEIGEGVNIGAATVTVNYDGYRKHRTVVGDGASVGSDTMLVAPVTVGKRAFTGAGSVITEDVPDGALAVERTPQRTIPGYRDRKDAAHGKGRSKQERTREGA